MQSSFKLTFYLYSTEAKEILLPTIYYIYYKTPLSYCFGAVLTHALLILM